MSTRLKPAVATPRTREEAETLVGQIAELKIFEMQTKSKMDQRLKEIREDYEQQLVSVTNQLTPLLLRVQAWADANLAEFGKSKSLEMLHGTIGYRIGNPTLKVRHGWTWARVLEALKALGHFTFVRVKEEVDRQAILAARENLLDGDLRQWGLQVIQEESFFVEPKLEPVDRRVTNEA